MALMRREALAKVEGHLGTGLGHCPLPLAPGLASLFPDGALRRGSTVSIGAGVAATSLALVLLSGPSAAGSWCAVVGVPDLGLVAAAQFGVDLGRLALVPSPGPKWLTAVSALLEGFDVVVVHPPGPVREADARNLAARSREQGSVLAVLACPSWPARPDIGLEVAAGTWRGLEKGFGYLAGRELEVVVSGRGGAARPRRGRLSLGEPADLGPAKAY